MGHSLNIRVYYEDTDLAGIVYYANYLKFIERGRSEWVRELGVDQVALKAAGQVFVVRRVKADYLSPAHYDDLLRVETELDQVRGARFVLDQRVLRDRVLLFTAQVTLVALDCAGRPTRLSAEFRRKLMAA